MASEYCQDIQDAEARDYLLPQLAEIQSRLLDVGSAVATPIESSSDRKLSTVAFNSSAGGRLEMWIDEMDASLPTLTNFILPSGGKASAQLHVARAVCRRAERAIVSLQSSVQPSVSIFLNRLSDYLFTAARYAALKDGRAEVIYKKAR
jgi:cob(I)alamin adenosyltransferase